MAPRGQTIWEFSHRHLPTADRSIRRDFLASLRILLLIKNYRALLSMEYPFCKNMIVLRLHVIPLQPVQPSMPANTSFE